MHFFKKQVLARAEITITVINDGTHTENLIEFTNSFNNIFVNVVPKPEEPVTNPHYDNQREFCQNKLPKDIKFLISNTEIEEVPKFISNPDESKAAGT